MFLKFPAETDKNDVSGEAALTGRAAQVVEQLLEKPSVNASGLLFPSGDLDNPDTVTGPIRREDLIDMLHKAEKMAGIDHVNDRAYHGIKRRFATVSKNRRAASKQSRTRESTLESIYEQDDDFEEKVALAAELEEKRVEQEKLTKREAETVSS